MRHRSSVSHNVIRRCFQAFPNAARRGLEDERLQRGRGCLEIGAHLRDPPIQRLTQQVVETQQLVARQRTVERDGVEDAVVIRSERHRDRAITPPDRGFELIEIMRGGGRQARALGVVECWKNVVAADPARVARGVPTGAARRSYF